LIGEIDGENRRFKAKSCLTTRKFDTITVTTERILLKIESFGSSRCLLEWILKKEVSIRVFGFI
jgi:hypothetical protein